MFVEHLSTLSLFNRNNVYGILVLKTVLNVLKAAIINLHPKLNGKNAAEMRFNPEKKRRQTPVLALQIHCVSHCNHVINATAISLPKIPLDLPPKSYSLGGTLDKLAIPILQADQRPS